MSMIEVIGAEGDIEDIDAFLEKVNKFAEENKILIQVFNADLIFGKTHILSAVQHAERAMNAKTNTTNSLEMEILLYASAERQLKNAIPKIGIVKGKSRIIFVIIGSKISDEIVDRLIKKLYLTKNDKVILGNSDTLKNFGIGKNDIKTVEKDKYEDLILEKIALLDTIK